MRTETVSRLEALAKVIAPTTFIHPFNLCSWLKRDFYVAAEVFQGTGSFKFRAAYNLAANVANEVLITASSGNFGQALSCACSLLNKKCIVVMPSTSARVKVDATRAWGARVELVDTKTKTRAQRVEELAAEVPEAYIASAYDDALVIEGNSSLGFEIANSSLDVDTVLVPVGGGGLAAGIIRGISQSRRPEIEVIAAEPALANDAQQSLREGRIISLAQESSTIADGARTLSLGKQNFAILKEANTKVIAVEEDAIRNAVKLAFTQANLKLEPTGALSLAAFISEPQLLAGRKVLCVATGGNVDPSVFIDLIAN